MPKTPKARPKTKQTSKPRLLTKAELPNFIENLIGTTPEIKAKSNDPAAQHQLVADLLNKTVGASAQAGEQHKGSGYVRASDIAMALKKELSNFRSQNLLRVVRARIKATTVAPSAAQPSTTKARPTRTTKTQHHTPVQSVPSKPKRSSSKTVVSAQPAPEAPVAPKAPEASTDAPPTNAELLAGFWSLVEEVAEVLQLDDLKLFRKFCKPTGMSRSAFDAICRGRANPESVKLYEKTRDRLVRAEDALVRAGCTAMERREQQATAKPETPSKVGRTRPKSSAAKTVTSDAEPSVDAVTTDRSSSGTEATLTNTQREVAKRMAERLAKMPLIAVIASDGETTFVIVESNARVARSVGVEVFHEALLAARKEVVNEIAMAAAQSPTVPAWVYPNVSQELAERALQPVVEEALRQAGFPPEAVAAIKAAPAQGDDSGPVLS